MEGGGEITAQKVGCAMFNLIKKRYQEKREEV
jgi:hypothetical protein